MGVSYLKSTLETGDYGSGGGAPDGATDGIKVNAIDYSVDRGAMKEETTDSYVYNQILGGALKISGTIESNFRPVSQATLLTGLFGTPAVAGTYTIGEPVPVCFAIGEKTGTVTNEKIFCGVGIKSAEFTFEAKEYVKARYEWLASDVKNGTYDTSLTFPTEDPLVFWRATLTLGATTLYSKSCSMTVDRALDEEQFVLGNYKLYRLTRTGITDISGTIGVTEEQIAELNRAIYGSDSGTAMPANNALGNGTLTIQCLKPDGTAGCNFVLPVTYTKSDFKSSSVGEFEKSIDYSIVGSMTVTVG
mgnify:CR=1 FL=1